MRLVRTRTVAVLEWAARRGDEPTAGIEADGPGRSWGLIFAVILGLGSALIAGCHESGPAPGLDAIGGGGLPLACGADGLCAAGTICDPATRTCVGCLSDAQCGSGSCHPVARVCVQCVEDGDCARGVCHPGQLVCVGCWDDSQCEGVCHPERGVCVGCLSDRDCGVGRCHLATSTCVGPCERDAQCDDGNACTIDRCEGGSCVYAGRDRETCDDGVACTVDDRCEGRVCRGERTQACCEPLVCRDGVPEDGDGDLCHDRCRCDDGTVVRPDARCPCPPEPRCPMGTRPVDADRDGCREACECASGAIIEPGGSCPCPQILTCLGGLVGSDLDGDGCADTCTQSCRTACDCRAQGLLAALECPQACPTCGPHLVCAAGVCQATCGIDTAICECPEPPRCGPLETAFDKDGDGCNDACRCLLPAVDGTCLCPFSISCGPGATPVDSDADGCPDLCLCEATGSPPGPDGRCCADIACGPREEPWDGDGDGCAEACRCRGGGAPLPGPDRCPCPAMAECPPGASAVDRDGDGCAEACVCGDGAAPGPLGCEGCLSECAGVMLEPGGYYIDADGDGCYERRDQCPIGTRAVAGPGAGCPDRCESCGITSCPRGAVATDTNADQCPDTCLCPGGTVAPPSGCGCGSPVTCGVGQTALDRDGDGCAEACAWSCRTACDCEADKVALESTCCVGCRAASVCLAGFCASSCEVVASMCEVVPEEAGTAAVCGCDGRTYTSACEANRARVDLASTEACEAVSCTSSSDCALGETCEQEAGVCGASDREGDTGVCVEVPTSCLAVTDPVCGCDGVTYTNDCERRRARVGLARLSACVITVPRRF